jgi:hypothetical protein
MKLKHICNNEAALLAINDDIAVGERVTICIETPVMRHVATVDKHGVASAGFGDEVDMDLSKKNRSASAH